MSGKIILRLLDMMNLREKDLREVTNTSKK